jgi:hypothetical protein
MGKILLGALERNPRLAGVILGAQSGGESDEGGEEKSGQRETMVTHRDELASAKKSF